MIYLFIILNKTLYKVITSFNKILKDFYKDYNYSSLFDDLKNCFK